MSEPYFDWFEELTEERKLERQVLLLVAGHSKGLEAGKLGELLERTHRDRWAPVYDMTWDLKRRGLITISPEPDDPEIKPCTYQVTEAGEVLAGEIREQALACGEYWRKQRPDLPKVEVIDNTEWKGARTVVFHFHNLVTESGSLSFATWTYGENFVRLWSPEGTFLDVLAWSPSLLVSSGDVQALVAAWGPVARRIYQHRIYPSPES